MSSSEHSDACGCVCLCSANGQPDLTQFACCVRFDTGEKAFVLGACVWNVRPAFEWNAWPSWSNARRGGESLRAYISAQRWSRMTAPWQLSILFAAKIRAGLDKAVISLSSCGCLACFCSAVTEMLQWGIAVLQQKWLLLQQRICSSM